MNKKIIVIVIFMIFIISSISNAYDNKDTHRRITKVAIPASKLDNYLKQNLGTAKGYKEEIKGKQIIDWFREGSYAEDVPNCRASNHFHNPLLPWNQSAMSDQPWWLDIACLDWKPWYSNVTWATGYLSPPPAGSKASFSTLYKIYNWDEAREVYHRALTTALKYDREDAFVSSFETLGHILHLLQDVSVPAHVRNDFTSHLILNGTISLNPKNWVIQPYEHYVKINPTLVATATPVFPSFANLSRLTDFWDTNQYNGGNPSTSLSIGLSEFANANYFSDSTIPSNNPTTEHSFPYPQVNLTNSYICEDFLPGSNKPTKYLSRTSCPTGGTGTVDHFAAISFMNKADNITNSNIQTLKVWLDDNVHNTYAKELIPRAVGYSAGLLDYFFRGNIEITLPNSGVYALTSDPNQGFTNIKLLAKNTTANNEVMSDGSIELVVKYQPTETGPVQYKVIPEANGLNSIPRDNPIELTFDLSQNQIPLTSTDIYFQVVFKGRLGNEDGAVAVGFKDVSEPTPIDIFNNMDKICINGAWYDAGSSTAIDLVDANHNGIADEWDVYPHTLEDIYIKISSPANPQNASSANYDYYVSSLAANNFLRTIYILSDYKSNPDDYKFKYSFQNKWIGTNPQDYWTHVDMLNIYDGTAIKNQIEYTDDPVLCNDNPPCYARIPVPYYSFRGANMWWGGGVIYINTPYPSGSQCSLDPIR